MTQSSAFRLFDTRRVAVAAGVLPLLLGACAHQSPPATFGELGDPMPEAAPVVRSHGPFKRAMHWVIPARPMTVSRRLGVDSPIASICATVDGRAVIDEDLPGLTSRPEYDFFKHMSLKTLKAMSRGKMTDEDLAKVGADLARLDEPDSAVR